MAVGAYLAPAGEVLAVKFHLNIAMDALHPDPELLDRDLRRHHRTAFARYQRALSIIGNQVP